MKIPLSEAAVSPPTASAEVVPEALGPEFSRNLGQIFRQSSVFFLGTLFTMGAGYLVKVYVARVLGAEQLGIYALGMTMVSLVQMAGMLGLHGTAPRFVAVYKATGKFDELRGYLTRSTWRDHLAELALGGWSGIGRELDRAESVPCPGPSAIYPAVCGVGCSGGRQCFLLPGSRRVQRRCQAHNDYQLCGQPVGHCSNRHAAGFGNGHVGLSERADRKLRNCCGAAGGGCMEADTAEKPAFRWRLFRRLVPRSSRWPWRFSG